MREAPLEGLTVVVTRPRSRTGRLARELRALGAEVVAFPTIRIRPPSDPRALRDALRTPDRFDWLVFTSARGVASVVTALAEDGRSAASQLGELPVAAIGPATAEAAREVGLDVRIVPGEYRAEALADALLAAVEAPDGRRVLLPRAAGAREVLPERLRRAGMAVVEVEAYGTEPAGRGATALRRRLDRGEIDWLTFTASSTVRSFVELMGSEVGSARVAAIGPITAATARELGMEVRAVAEEYTIPGLVRALVGAVAGRKGD